MTDKLPPQWMQDRATAIIDEFGYINEESRKQHRAAIIEAMQEAARQEREACALICDEQADGHDFVANSDAEKAADACAVAIRARSDR